MTKGKQHQFVAWFFFVAIVGGYLLMATKFPLAYIIATYEDLVGEWAQVFLFATTMLLSAKLALGKSGYRLFFTVLALACFYVVGEEISWGQRLLDIATPQFFKTHNLQNETNLHNVLTGPISTGIKSLLEYVIAAGLVVYGGLYPLLIQRRWKPALWCAKQGLAFPPLYLWPFFIASAFLELGLFNFNEAEIAEILIPLALSITALNYLQAERNQQNMLAIPTWGQPEATRLARQTMLTVLSVFILALSTTTACYASPRLGKSMERRYINGVEKFAGRYLRQGKAEIAINLYQLVAAKAPEQTVVLRNLSRAYTQLNEHKTAQSYLEKALEVDYSTLQDRPYSVASNMSLVSTYRLLGEVDKAQYHLTIGLDDAKKAVLRRPKSAVAAFWLGEAESKSNDFPAALQAYQRAAQLRPDVLKYQKAVLRLSKHLAQTVNSSDNK